MSAGEIDSLIRPASIAIIGASSDPKKTAGRPLKYLRAHGFAGRLMPVNPTVTSIDGLRCYPDIAALPETPDVAMVLLDVVRTEPAIAQLAARGVQHAIVFNGGYQETGPEGAERQARLKAAAGPMRLLGPNTIGLINVTDRIALSASTSLEATELQRGRIGLISQSGGVLGSILSRAQYKGIGFSKLIATGNEADYEAADFISWFANDSDTEVIALYLETIRNGDLFRKATRAATEAGKRIVAYKVGRSEAGAQSASSHTGALAGADSIYDALFRQTGVVRAADFSDLLDVSAALSSGRKLHGGRIGILTTTGGAGALIADACGVLGFTTPPPDAATATRLGALMIGDGAVPDRNPIDLTLAGLRPDIMNGAIDALMSSEAYDATVVIVGSSGIDRPGLVADAARDNIARHRSPLAIYVSPCAPNIIQALNREGIPAFDTPEGCAAALAAMRIPVRDQQADAPRAPVDVFDLRSGRLDEVDSRRLFGRFGIPGVRERVVHTPQEAEAAARELDRRVAIKILSKDLAHKSDVGGVALNIVANDAARACAEMAERVKTHLGGEVPAFLVQEMVSDGVELILGIVRDPRLGTAVMLGAGGVLAELLDDTCLRMAPLSRSDAEEMIASLRISPLLSGYRGRPAADVVALTDAVLAFSRLACELGDRLVDAEINPLLVLPDGKGVMAVDALIEIA